MRVKMNEENILFSITDSFVNYVKHLKEELDLADYKSALNLIGHAIEAHSDSDPLSGEDWDYTDDGKIRIHDSWKRKITD